MAVKLLRAYCAALEEILEQAMPAERQRYQQFLRRAQVRLLEFEGAVEINSEEPVVPEEDWDVAPAVPAPRSVAPELLRALVPNSRSRSPPRSPKVQRETHIQIIQLQAPAPRHHSGRRPPLMPGEVEERSPQEVGFVETKMRGLRLVLRPRA